MQTDTWLIESGNRDLCPLCSKPLNIESGTCYACGFTASPSASSSVWIDPAVYGYQGRVPAGNWSVHSAGQKENRRRTGEADHVRSAPPPGASSSVWQYESPHYEGGGSLPALSLLVAETPTRPQPAAAAARITRRLPRIDEVDTVPPSNEPASRALVPVTQQADVMPAYSSSSSWTAGEAADSPHARRIAARSRSKRHHRSLALHPLDHVRWWLLRPGRIEFMLWLGGTILLVGVTCALLLISAFSCAWFIPGLPGGLASINSASPAGHGRTAIITSPGLSLLLLDRGAFSPGQPIRLQGAGFTPLGPVTFTLDGVQPLLDQNGKPGGVQADNQGIFTATLWLGMGPAWSPGAHLVVARDAVTNHLAAVDIVLAAGSTETGISTSSSPVPPTMPGTTPTANPTTPVVQPTPVGQTPVPTTPTPKPSPSSTPTQTPPTVTPTPTRGTTPTPSPTSTPRGTPSPTVSPTKTGSSSLGNALSESGEPPFGKGFSRVSPLVWVIVACYSLSMILLGVAGVVHKQRH